MAEGAPAATRAPPWDRRVLVAAVGYDNLRDFSVGPVLLDRLRGHALPAGAELANVSFGAISALHWWRENGPFDAAIFVAAAVAGGVPGSVRASRWTQPALSTDEVQAHVADAVMGIVSLPTLLVVLGHFGALPDDVTVVEIAPRDHDWGPTLSPPVEAALAEAGRVVERELGRLLA